MRSSVARVMLLLLLLMIMVVVLGLSLLAYLNRQTKNTNDTVHRLILPSNRAASWNKNNRQKDNVLIGKG